ncbi:Transketolase (TK) [Magnetospirillum gryphiswaldense MSR-1 v2]|uniref:Transketolase n=1 Tax=Magnetospirillum gryphiswaldense (strain DSM 6361 / JCM 21280 / NBRC 15271 / MSR-1) TaxID=431944 RepID=V6F950_MAGGM|nr:transketolase [Magnetospirillum gryphiswaldense]CDL01361.1 Transketolase (TK) [Magnetospirillum gryphiswaldense MSR-1 v2]
MTASVPNTATHAEMANAIRFLSMDAIEKAKSGHPGMPMGMADVATVLFTRFMKFDAKSPKWADRDRFVLSAGHGSMLLYSLGYLTGYDDLDIEQIKNFRQLGYRTAGHPEFGHVSNADTTTGPLGQGITNAVGFALAEAMQAARYGAGIANHYTYVIAGDGCLMEGISQEAITLAGHLKLNKMIVLWDDNHICIDGDTALSTSDDQCARFAAAGWATAKIDGHDPEQIASAIAAARNADKPTLIACRTIIGKGAPNKCGSEKVHGAPLGADEIKAARDAANWPYEPFVIPDHVLAAWRAAGSRGAVERQAWEGRLSTLAAAVKAEFSRTQEGRLPDGWQAAVQAFKAKISAEQPKVATRKASQDALEVLTAAIPEMIGGSADLTHSNLTNTKACAPSIAAGAYAGRYIHYGIREHGMAAVMNGLALHGGFIPYGGTFLIFANYLWPALRMSALMEQRVLYVLTHDSIGLGEDGPTHQPIETIAALRATPNTLVFRPADAVETMEAYEVALLNHKGPSCFALSRQNLPTLRTTHTSDNLTAKGAYVLVEAEGKRQVTLLATGSEVSLALDARKLLAAKGVQAAVVSMPCWELFDRQSKEYRAEVLGDGCVRVAVEALTTFGWERYVGLDGAVIGMTGYGASAPADKLYAHFGITADAVADAALARL